MERKDPNPSGSDPAGDQPTLDDIPSSAPLGLTARYDILGELGRGGMGIVYKARDRETGAVVALKVLRPEIAADTQAVERFKSELLLARKITHKNACRIHELLRFGDTVAISMEYVEGESLRAILHSPGGVALRRGLEWLPQICAVLAEAHSQGVVHRDLKPENILITREGTAKVMDFGIARSLESDLTQTGRLIGTPAYMSPEQAQGKPADPRSDIYSLGLIIYEMFTGQAAFRAETPVALAVKQIHETPPPASEVEPHLPAFLGRAIQKCLEKSATKRFQSAEELATALAGQPEAKPALAEGAEAPLPVLLTRWQPSDWLLLISAIAGLALVFPFFDRTSLAPRSKVSFDRSVLRRIAQEYTQKLGAPLGQGSQISVDSSFLQYDSLARWAGARAALELANNPVPYWMWRVDWENRTGVRVDNRGSLLTFSRDFPARPPVERLPIEEAKPLAEKALREFFKRDPALLVLETAAGDTWGGQAATSFTWADPNDYQGLKRRYVVRLVGREIANLDSRFDLPAGYVWPNVLAQGLPSVVLVLVMAMLGFSQRQQVDLAARWRIAVVAAEFVGAGLFGWWVAAGAETPVRIVLSAFMGLGGALVVFFASVAIEQSVSRTAGPARFSSFVRLFDRRAASEPCGLAISRGTLVGLALLGGDTFLVWLGTNRLGMRLDILRHILVQSLLVGSPGNPWPSAFLVLDAFGHALIIMLGVVFLASFVARFVRRSWLTAFLAAALAAASTPGFGITSLGAVQPYHWKLLLLLFDSLVLVWTLTRFDVLTVCWAGVTFALCWQNYFLLVMFEPTGAVEQWLAFAVWGSFVLAAAGVAFKTPFRAAYQRAATAFE